MKGWIKPTLWALAAVWATCWAGAAKAERCPSPRAAGITPSIQISVELTQPRYWYSVGRNRLTAMHNQTNNGSRHGTVLGLTVHGPISASSPGQYTRTNNSGQPCYYIRNLNSTLTMTSLDVYIAAEYRQGTCEAQVITTHENEHVRIYHAALQKYGPVMRETLARLAETPFNSVGELEQAIRTSRARVFETMIQEARRGNGSIDTQDSYKRTGARCKNWK